MRRCPPAQSIKLLKYGTLKTYPGFPHGMPTTHGEQINADMLGFCQGSVAEKWNEHAA
jgi:hypothetical protein